MQQQRTNSSSNLPSPPSSQATATSMIPNNNSSSSSSNTSSLAAVAAAAAAATQTTATTTPTTASSAAAATPATTTTTATQNNINFNNHQQQQQQLGSLMQQQSTSSPLNSFYGPGSGSSVVDTLNNAANNNDNNPLAKSSLSSAQTAASHSALAAAATLQSLNQSHLQRSQQLAQLHQQQQQSTRPPSNQASMPQLNNNAMLPSLAHSQSQPNHSNTNNPMPKLGITSTTSSNHQNHNHHLALFNQQQLDNFNNLEFIKFQQHQQQQQLQQQKLLPPGVRPPINWQDQAAAAAIAAANNHQNPGPRWSSFANNSNVLGLAPNNLTTPSANNLSNSNNMIGQQDQQSISDRHKSGNEQRQLSSNNHNFNIPSSNINPSIRQNFPNNQQQWLDNFNKQQIPSLQKSLEEEKISFDKMQSFINDILNIYTPHDRSKQKTIVIIDHKPNLRQSILSNEFYTKFEDLAYGILTNQIYVIDFSIFDYIRLNKFNVQELERMEIVHKRANVTSYINCLQDYFTRPAQQLQLQQPNSNYPPFSKASNYHPDNASMMNQLNLTNAGIILQNQQQMQLSQQQIHALRNANLLPLSNNNSGNSNNNNKVLPGLEQQINLLDKNRPRSSSQSPSDIMSRFQASLNNNNHNNNIPSTMSMNFGHLLPSHPPAPHNQQHHHQRNPLPPPPPIPQPSHSQRSSPFNYYSLGQQPPTSRPPRANSTIGIAHEPPMIMNNPLQQAPRQPPAAHQSSTAKFNLAGSSLNSTSHHSSISGMNGPPVSAHMSSKTPQTPRLLTSETTPPKPMNNDMIHSHSPAGRSMMMANNSELERQKYLNNNMPPISIANFNQPTSKYMDIDSAVAGLPVQTLLSLKQQELINRDIVLKQRNGSNQLYPDNNSGSNSFINNVPNSIDLARSPNHHIAIDPHSSSRSPINVQHQQQIAALYQSNINDGNLLKPATQVNYSNSSMPPPNAFDTNRFNSTPVNNLQLSQNVSGNNEAQLKQYMVNAYHQQQQQLLMNTGVGKLPSNIIMSANTSPSTSNFNTNNFNQGQQSQESPQGSLTETMILNIQNNKSAPNQQASPMSNNQRSIITGSASSGSNKRTKKQSSKQNSPTLTSNTGSGDLNPVIVDEIGSALKTENSKDNGRAENVAGATVISRVSTISPGDSENLPDNAGDYVSKTAAENCKSAEKCHEPTLSQHDETSVIEKRNDFNEITDLNFNLNTKINEKQQDDISISNPVVASNSNIETSKYQKLYTKKAWLRNYDQEEDQARNNPNNITVNSDNNSSATVIKNSPVVDETMAQVKAEDATQIEQNFPKNNSKSNSNDKQVRRMPSRKVKPNSDNDQNKSLKNPIIKDFTKKRGKKEKISSDDSSKSDSVGKRKHSNATDTATEDVDEIDEEDQEQYGIDDDDEDEDEENAVKKNKKKIKLNSGASKGVTKEENDKNSTAKRNKQAKKGTSNSKKMRFEKFLQTDPCYDLVPKNFRCMECRRVRQSSLKNNNNSDKTSTSKQSSKTNWDDFCRFYEFRKLRYNKAKQIVVAGFSDLDDAEERDKILWSPHTDEMPKNLTFDVAKFILKNVGNDFCKLVLEERAALEDYRSTIIKDDESDDCESSKKITWKRAVNGLRELCDVCSTTLFNCHYVCERCGFVVCIDCYKSRAQQSSGNSIQINELDLKSENIKKEINTDKAASDETSYQLSAKATNNNNISSSNSDASENGQSETPDQKDSSLSTTSASSKKNKRDSSGWIYCAKNEEHLHEKLILTQIIAGDCLEEVWKMLHEIRKKLNLGNCMCEDKKSLTSGHPVDLKIEQTEVESMSTSIANIKQEVEEETVKEKFLEETEGTHSTLKGLLLASNSQNNCSNDALNKMFNDDEEDSQEDTKLSQQVTAAIEGCISSIPGGANEEDNSVDAATVHSLGDSERTLVEQTDEDMVTANTTPIPQTNSILTSPLLKVEKNATHDWLCDGDLLVLSQPNHEKNVELFRQHWTQGKPVLVRGVDKLMQIDMWLPQFFGKQFGDYRSDLVDCRNGDIHRHSMKKYWEGFEPTNGSIKKNKSNSNKDNDSNISVSAPSANNEELSIGPCYYSGSALWRLKDWPPGQDFNEILPKHYEDFMNNLPLEQYTTRCGELNLACRLPKEMLKPDLGPKMYSAYGTSKFPERGTTNLHLDISDAINVMVYVSGATSFKNGSEEISDIFTKTMDECVIDKKMSEQIRSRRFIPGALWHIFKPSDVQKMRDFLNKVADERNISLEKRTDPIHDQTWYLDQVLLDRLEQEYGVKSYAVLQCMGDAILIPAGSPHQVKNIQNCIKVANDFVSPENVRYCLKLTNEFRSLPETHINQEDKLQIKNILYHSVKESLQYIRMFETETSKA